MARVYTALRLRDSGIEIDWRTPGVFKLAKTNYVFSTEF